MSTMIWFFVFALLLCGVVFALWRYWNRAVRLSHEEQVFDDRMAALNERQSNRMSDDQLTHPPTEDDAWQIMVNRGRHARMSHDRYAGDLTRRTRERRRRS